jgi:hypothetical protein
VGALGESSSGSFEGAGIEGESLDHTGSDAAGAFGLTLLSNGVAPNYGVIGYGSLYGVYGQAGNTGLSSTGPGYGVFGQDNAGKKTADYNSGVTGLSAYGTGIFALAAGAPSLGIAGTGRPIGLYAVADTDGGSGRASLPNDYAAAAVGVEAESNATAFSASNTYFASEGYFVQTDLSTLTPGNGEFFIYGRQVTTSNGTTTDSNNWYVDAEGDEYLAGTVTDAGGTNLHTQGVSGTVATAYGENATTPQLEDVGYGALVNGRGVVKFDAALADVIDVRPGYHVFLTPDGDSKSLYVEQKTASGFVVREAQSGRSTIAFEYRIVAKPLRLKGERLARVTDSNAAVVHGSAKATISQALPLPLSPEQHLKNRIGTAAYAKLMLTLRNRFTAHQ